MTIKTTQLPAVGNVDDFLVNGNTGASSDAARVPFTTMVTLLLEGMAPFLSSGGLAYASWTALSADTTRPANQLAVVPSNPGTHTDPVVGGTVPNSGIYSWSVSPAGWKRVGSYGGGDLGPLAVESALGNKANLFNPDTITPNKLVTGGSLSDETTTGASDFIMVTPGGSVVTNLEWGGGRGPIFFDADKVYLSDGDWHKNVPISVPANALYVRVSVPMAGVNRVGGIATDNYMIVRGTTIPAGFSSFGAPGQEDTVKKSRQIARSLLSDRYDLTRFRFGSDRSTPTSGLWSVKPILPLDAYIDGMLQSNGNIITGIPGWYVTGFCPVTPGGQVTTGAMTNPGNGYAFYSKEKIFVSGLDGPFTEGQVLTVPANAFYIRGTNTYLEGGALGSPSVGWKYQLFDGNVSPYPHKFDSMPATVSMFRPWTGKKWSFHGDSMGATRTGNSWITDVAQYHGCRQCNVLNGDGRQSIHLLKHVNVGGVGAAPDIETTYFNDIDLVVVIVGTNDLAVGRPVGTIDDPPDGSIDTYMSWYKKFIEFVLTHSPFTRIVLATSLYRGADSNPYAIMPYQAAVRTLCQHYALKLWDVGVESQLSAITSAAYTAADDGLHPDYHVGNILPFGTAIVATDQSSLLVFGSQLRGFLHHVVPINYVGDPVLNMGTLEMNPENF